MSTRPADPPALEQDGGWFAKLLKCWYKEQTDGRCLLTQENPGDRLVSVSPNKLPYCLVYGSKGRQPKLKEVCRGQRDYGRDSKYRFTATNMETAAYYGEYITYYWPTKQITVFVDVLPEEDPLRCFDNQQLHAAIKRADAIYDGEYLRLKIITDADGESTIPKFEWTQPVRQKRRRV